MEIYELSEQLKKWQFNYVNLMNQFIQFQVKNEDLQKKYGELERKYEELKKETEETEETEEDKKEN